jgi:hypothetical protein
MLAVLRKLDGVIANMGLPNIAKMHFPLKVEINSLPTNFGGF